jgi:hypothetical protein
MSASATRAIRPTETELAHDLSRDLRRLADLEGGPAAPEASGFVALHAALFWRIALRRALWAEQQVDRLAARVAELERALGVAGASQKVVDLDAARRAREAAVEHGGTATAG